MTAQVKADGNGHRNGLDVADVPARFPLVRYFLVASVVAIAAVTVVTAFLFVRFAEHSFVLSSEARSRDEAVHFVELFRHSVWLPSRQENPGAALTQIDPHVLNAFAKDVAFGLRIAQVNLLSPGGKVVYSTDSALIGAALNSGTRYERVLVSDLPDAGFMPGVTLTVIGGERRDIDVVETLAPIQDMDPGPGEVGRTIGVLEIVHDITEDLADAKAASVRSAVIGSASMSLVLVVVLFLIVRRADKRIDRGHRQLITQKELLHDSEEQYRVLYEDAPLAYFSVGNDGRIKMFNRQAQQLLGYNGDELLRSPIADLYADVPEGKAKAQELFHRFLAGHEIRGAELAMRRADGELVWVGLTVRTIFDSNGDVAESRSMLVDITEQKKAERELQLSNARLEETLSALTETQQQIVQQERLRALGQMASGVAHDFNNLLTPIVGYSELLLTSPQHLGDQDTVERYVRLINTAGQDAANVVKNLREFYREHDSREDFVPIALGELIQQAISLTQAKWKDQAQAGGKTITIETDFNPVPPVCGSQTQLREVLINLIINATDAITSDGTITLRVYADGAQVALDVADTGSGMTEGVRRQCLDPFFTTKGSVGTGLGLATAAGAIRRHGGSIDVATKEGEGTTFTIRIPIHADESGDADNEVTEPTFAPAMRVLVVDDEETVRGLLADYLRADGHTVETAADGREGLERYCAGSFDLVVTDRAMPEMNGDQLAEAIRKERRAAYIIMLTGYGDSFRADKEFPNGVDFVLNKPIRRKELRQALVAVAG